MAPMVFRPTDLPATGGALSGYDVIYDQKSSLELLVPSHELSSSVVVVERLPVWIYNDVTSVSCTDQFIDSAKAMFDFYCQLVDALPKCF